MGLVGVLATIGVALVGVVVGVAVASGVVTPEFRAFYQQMPLKRKVLASAVAGATGAVVSSLLQWLLPGDISWSMIVLFVLLWPALIFWLGRAPSRPRER